MTLIKDDVEPQYESDGGVRSDEEEGEKFRKLTEAEIQEYEEQNTLKRESTTSPPPKKKVDAQEEFAFREEFKVKEEYIPKQELDEEEELPIISWSDMLYKEPEKQQVDWDDAIRDTNGPAPKKKYRVSNVPYFIILTIAATGLAGTAAYFSVFGLSKIFAGAQVPAIIMAVAIEFGKIVSVSYSNRFWSRLKSLKVYMLGAIIIAMIVTSASIYGFLSSAYQRTADKMAAVETRMGIESMKKDLLKDQVESKKIQIDSKTQRIGQLSEVRSNQEVRLDSLYRIRYYTTAKRTESIIQRADDEIALLTGEINTLSGEIGSLNDSIFVHEEIVLEMRNTDETAELGPLRFTARLLGVEMDRIVAVFIIMLIVVFDPMAMALIIAINRLVVINKEDKDQI